MERPSTQYSKLFIPTIFIYILYLSVILYTGWISNLNFKEISSILTPSLSEIYPYSIFARVLLNIPFDPITIYYIILLAASISSLYALLKIGAFYAIPYLMLSIYLGDYISPLIFSLAVLINSKIAKGLLFSLLTLHEPLYLIPCITGGKQKTQVGRVSYALLVILLFPFYGIRYLDYAGGLLSNPFDVIPLILILMVSLILFRVRGLHSLTVLLSPYASLVQVLDIYIENYDVRVDRGKIYLLIVVAIIFLGALYIPQRPIINLNGSLDQFIDEAMGNASTVLSLSRDSYINSLLTSKGIYVVQYDDAFRWNWSNREEVREKLSDALEYAENHGIKYVLIDKPKELAYWVSPKHYNEYKYPLREPLGRYIIVLERKGFVETASNGLYLKNFYLDEEISLSFDYIKHWSNVTVDIWITGKSIKIESDRAYEVYLHFRVENISGYYLFKLESGRDYFRSIEFYVYNGRLNSLWESSNKRFYNPIMVELKSDIDGELVFKIEHNSTVTLYLCRLESPDIYDVVRIGKTILAEGKNRFISGDLEDFSGSKHLYFSYTATDYTFTYDVKGPRDLEAIFLLFIGLIFLSIFYREEFRYLGLTLDTGFSMVYTYLYLLSVPVIVYLIHPRLLEISWIGGGVFLIALSMGVFTLLLETKEVDINKFMGLTASILLIISIGFTIKYFYGDYFDLIGDFWRNQSLYAAIDVLTFGVLGLVTSIYFLGYRNIHFHIPYVYLVVSGTSFITDLMKVSNPILQGLIDLATYLVEFSMEVFGYRIEYVTVPAGNALYVYSEKLLTVVILGWPCTGVTGIFIFLSFAAVLNIYFRERFGYSIPKSIVILGLIITYLLNIARIDLILYLDIYYGVDASELFHSIGYELVFLVWIAIFFLIVYRIYLRKSS